VPAFYLACASSLHNLAFARLPEAHSAGAPPRNVPWAIGRPLVRPFFRTLALVVQGLFAVSLPGALGVNPVMFYSISALRPALAPGRLAGGNRGRGGVLGLEKSCPSVKKNKKKR